MRNKHMLILAILVFLFPSLPGYAGNAPSESIEINKREGAYELTVPVSRLTMTIPAGGLSQGIGPRENPADNPRYFYFADNARHLIVSGWFESAQGYPGIKAFWENETRAWKKGGLPEPKEVVFKKIADWDAIMYDISVPGKTNSHIRAHWLQAGTWIDVHLSMTSDKTSSEQRAVLQALLKTFHVGEKSSQESALRKYILPDHGTLHLTVSAPWKDELRQPPDRLPPTIVFTQKHGAPFEILITTLWPSKSNAVLPKAEELKQTVKETADQLKSQAVEKTITIKELKRNASPGYYFTLTDRAPRPGEYKYMTQGMMRVGDLLLVFTVLTNDGQENIIEEALTMLKSASHQATM